jgi:hypothetical protein
MFGMRSALTKAAGVALSAAVILTGVALFQSRLSAGEIHDEALAREFAYLSQNGNSNCSAEFMDAIATMPAVALLQGSCCSPMDEHRYVEQLEGLRKYKDVAAIPPNPYNIPVGLAQELMPHYALELTETEQAAYNYAMENSDEGGPCCCGCWRWEMYGGLAKKLIREQGFTGEQIAELWDLSDGCGGDEDHNHA